MPNPPPEIVSRRIDERADGGTPVRILIVDDSPETRFTYRRYLSASGSNYVFGEAETVEQGLQQLASGSFDCVLLDFRLPDADGLEFLARISESETNGTTPVIVTTSQGSEAVAVEAMKLGAKDYLVKGNVNAVNLPAAVSKALRLARQELEIQQKTEQLRRLSVTDELTKLHNRRYLVERLSHALSRKARYGNELSLMMIDLDHFKRVNDTHGHQVGDQVLIRFSQMLASVARTTDVVARMGGEEFCLVLCHTGVEGARVLASRICEEARSIAHRDQDGEEFRVTCSVGLAAATAEDATCDALLHKSDVALYEAKRQSRDCVRVYVDSPPPERQRTA